MAIITNGETRCDGFGCKDHQACIKKYAERDRLLAVFAELSVDLNLGIISNNAQILMAEKHELIQQLQDENHVKQASMLGMSVRNRVTKEVYDSLDIEVLSFKYFDPEPDDKPFEIKMDPSDVRLVKFFVELLQCIIELYAIPPERLRKVIQANDLKKTEAKTLEGVKHTHTLYKVLFDSLEYIHNKYFKKD